jgi:hypothetical protein
MFFNFLTPAFADNGNASNDIEKIVTTNNGKIIYYENGGMDAFFSINENVQSSQTSPTLGNSTSDGTNETLTDENGTKNFNVVLSFPVHVSDSTSATFQIIQPSFPLIGIMQIIKEILDTISQILEGIFGPVGIVLTLLSAEILAMLKSLRKNRPKDYNGVTWRRA